MKLTILALILGGIIILLTIGLISERAYNQQLLEWIELQGNTQLEVRITPGIFDNGVTINDGIWIAK